MILAVDTGGTKTIVASFTSTGTIIDSIVFPTPKDIEIYLQIISDHIRSIAKAEPIDSISMALPGVIHDGVAVWCANLGWQDVPIHNMMHQLFPSSTILVDNDANLAGLASMRRLETVPHCGLYITIGTGIGTAIILDGELDDALSKSEGGHMMLEYRGKTSTWEHIAAGRVLNEIYGDLSDISAPEIWPDVAERINAGLRTIVPLIQPEVIVIGGAIGRFVDKFDTMLLGLLAESLPSSIPCPQIIAAPNPEEMVLYGCYDALIQYGIA